MRVYCCFFGTDERGMHLSLLYAFVDLCFTPTMHVRNETRAMLNEQCHNHTPLCLPPATNRSGPARGGGIRSVPTAENHHRPNFQRPLSATTYTVHHALSTNTFAACISTLALGTMRGAQLLSMFRPRGPAVRGGSDFLPITLYHSSLCLAGMSLSLRPPFRLCSAGVL
jgi:hypothetical protein